MMTTNELPLDQPVRSTISWITGPISAVCWSGPASPIVFHAGGLQDADAVVLGREEMPFVAVVKVDAVSEACPSMMSEVACERALSAWNWMAALAIVAPCGTVMPVNRRPTSSLPRLRSKLERLTPPLTVFSPASSELAETRTWNAIGVSVGVAVGVALGVAVGVGVAIGVPVGVAVGVGIGVAVGVPVAVAVGVGVGVAVGVPVAVAVGVGVGVAVGVPVAVAVGVAVGVGVGVPAGVAVGVGVPAGVAVGVGVADAVV
jgi:hypothetical protein